MTEREWANPGCDPQVVDDLTDTMAVNDRHEVILYKKMTLGSVALALLRHEKPDLVLIQNTPIESHVRVLPHL